MSARYVPINVKLEARESINSESQTVEYTALLTLTTPDMGVLRVDVIGAKGLMAADRSGKSDVGDQRIISQ